MVTGDDVRRKKSERCSPVGEHDTRLNDDVLPIMSPRRLGRTFQSWMYDIARFTTCVYLSHQG